MADMFGFQNMDASMEQESLQCGLEYDEVNLLDYLSSPPRYDNFHFGAVAASHLPFLEQERHGRAQVESSDVNHSVPPLPANNYHPDDVELAEAVAGVWEPPIQESTAASDTLAAATTVSHVPVGPTDDVTAPALFQPQLLPSTSPLEEWFGRGMSTSFDQAPPNYPADFLSCQHENIQRLQAMDISMEQETNNETVLGKNMAAPNASLGIISHQNLPSQPSSIHINPVERGVGITGSGTLSQGQLLSNKQPQTTSWNSKWVQYLKSPPGSALDLRFAPYSLPYDTPAIHRPQQFHPLTSQVGHVPTVQHTFDSPNSMKPPSPTSSRSESSSNCQSPTATMPPNTYDHQPAFPRLMLPEPAVSTRPTATILSPNHHPQPTGSSVLSSFMNSFEAGPSVPQRYPDIRDYQRNFLLSQQTKSHDSFVPQTLGLSPLSGSPLVSDKSNDYSQLWSRRSSVLGSSPFLGSPILPKISLPMMSSPSQPITIAPEGSNASSFLRFKPREPSRLPWYPYRSSNHLAPTSTDIFRSNLYSGNFLTPSSSARPPMSNRVRRILNLGNTPPKPKAASSSGKRAATSKRSAPQTNADPLQSSQFQDPVERWIKDLETVLNKDWNGDEEEESQPTKEKSASLSARGPGGRREKGGSSSSKRRKSNSADKGKEEAHPIPEEAPITDEHEVNVLQSPKPLQMYQPREVDNTAYGMHYQSMAVLMDPHISEAIRGQKQVTK